MQLRHPPSRKRNAIHLGSQTPLVSAVKRVSKTLETKKFCMAVGSGRAIQKVLCLALELQRQGFGVEVATNSLVVQDEEINEDKEVPVVTERTISSVELTVTPKKTVLAS